MATDAEHPRPQAGPLPTKRGEIGYTEDIHGAAMMQMDMELAASRQPVAMGERHPADRRPETMNAGGGAALGPPGAPAGAQGASDNVSTRSGSSSRRMMKRAKASVPHLGGITYITLFKLFFQLAVLAGTGVGWAFTTIMVKNQPATQTVNNADSSDSFSGASTAIFIHVAFSIVTLAELVFLERRIFRIRAERYAHLHPGEMLSRGRQLNASMPMVPWQRPSLPTYAAALAQSGVRTGDVEDALIAQPPPPAYGKIRGSTLLLRGFLSSEQNVRAREFDAEAQFGPDGEPISRRSSRSLGGSMVMVDFQDSRPVSYRSEDSYTEMRMDMERASAVEQALAAMEGVPAAHISDRDRP